MSDEAKDHDILEGEIDKLAEIIVKIEEVIEASCRDLDATILIRECLKDSLKIRPKTGELEIIVDD